MAQNIHFITMLLSYKERIRKNLKKRLALNISNSKSLIKKTKPEKLIFLYKCLCIYISLSIFDIVTGLLLTLSLVDKKMEIFYFYSVAVIFISMVTQLHVTSPSSA